MPPESRRELTEEERRWNVVEIQGVLQGRSVVRPQISTNEAESLAKLIVDAVRVVPVSSEPTPFDDEGDVVLTAVPAREIVKGDMIMHTDLPRRVHDVKEYVAVIPGTANNGLSFDFGDGWYRFEEEQPVWRISPARPVVEPSPGNDDSKGGEHGEHSDRPVRHDQGAQGARLGGLDRAGEQGVDRVCRRGPLGEPVPGQGPGDRSSAVGGCVRVDGPGVPVVEASGEDKAAIETQLQTLLGHAEWTADERSLIRYGWDQRGRLAASTRVPDERATIREMVESAFAAGAVKGEGEALSILGTALRFYAEGNADQGEKAKGALAAVPENEQPCATRVPDEAADMREWKVCNYGEHGWYEITADGPPGEDGEKVVVVAKSRLAASRVPSAPGEYVLTRPDGTNERWSSEEAFLRGCARMASASAPEQVERLRQFAQGIAAQGCRTAMRGYTSCIDYRNSARAHQADGSQRPGVPNWGDAGDAKLYRDRIAAGVAMCDSCRARVALDAVSGPPEPTCPGYQERSAMEQWERGGTMEDATRCQRCRRLPAEHPSGPPESDERLTTAQLKTLGEADHAPFKEISPRSEQELIVLGLLALGLLEPRPAAMGLAWVRITDAGVLAAGPPTTEER